MTDTTPALFELADDLDQIAADILNVDESADPIGSISAIASELRKRDLTPELSGMQPMGWLAQELAGESSPVVIQSAIKYCAHSRSTMYHEIVLIDPVPGTDVARLAITNQYTGHTEVWNLPEGIRLIAVST